MTRWFTKAPLEQQLIGLEPLWPEIGCASVLDVGCAEGLISWRCLKSGARLVHGIDDRQEAIKEAAGWVSGYARAHGQVFGFWTADAEVWEPPQSYDVVLMLGILHKLKNPAKALCKYLTVCDEFAVFRLPEGGWPILQDSRSGNQPFDLERVAHECGFKLTETAAGPRGQTVGYLWRQ